jgi:hypothetical protein
MHLAGTREPRNTYTVSTVNPVSSPVQQQGSVAVGLLLCWPRQRLACGLFEGEKGHLAAIGSPEQVQTVQPLPRVTRRVAARPAQHQPVAATVRSGTWLWHIHWQNLSQSCTCSAGWSSRGPGPQLQSRLMHLPCSIGTRSGPWKPEPWRRPAGACSDHDALS